MTTPRIHMYFDIDGVLNPHGDIPRNITDRWDYYEDPTPLLTQVPELITAVNRIITTYPVTPFWLSSWEENSPWFGEQVGLTGSEDWEWLPAVSNKASEGEWQKFTTIQHHITTTQPDLVVWCEDDLLRYDEEPIKWAASRPDVLPIAPNPAVGISPTQIATIEGRIRGALQQ